MVPEERAVSRWIIKTTDYQRTLCLQFVNYFSEIEIRINNGKESQPIEIDN